MLPAALVALGFVSGIVLLRTILREITAVRSSDWSPDRRGRPAPESVDEWEADLTDEEPRLILG